MAFLFAYKKSVEIARCAPVNHSVNKKNIEIAGI